MKSSHQFILQHAPSNPTLEYAESIQIPKGVTDILSIGGGSTLDVGKWLSFKYKLYHTAIPTTAGTGSEVTRYCVLMVDGKKKTYELRKPDSYILDPRLVTSLPELHTLSSGMDALCQALESFWSVNATNESKNYAVVAYEMVIANLKKSMEEPQNEIYRMNMLIAANLAGRAIEITKTNICHAISYPLTELYGIPHGIACAMSVRYFAKKHGIDLEYWFLQFKLPKYEVDKKKVAEVVLKDSKEKLRSYPHKVTKLDIVQSLLN